MRLLLRGLGGPRDGLSVLLQSKISICDSESVRLPLQRPNSLCKPICQCIIGCSLQIRCAACQCIRTGFSRNWDRVMAYAMLGHVATTAYIGEPTSSGSLYGVFTISRVASSVLSDWAFNRRCPWSCDVLIMFASFILNLARIKAMCVPWHRDVRALFALVVVEGRGVT